MADEHWHRCGKHEGQRIEWHDLYHERCPTCENDAAVAEVEELLKDTATSMSDMPPDWAEQRAAERITERALDPLPDLGIEMPLVGGCAGVHSYEPADSDFPPQMFETPAAETRGASPFPPGAYKCAGSCVGDPCRYCGSRLGEKYKRTIGQFCLELDRMLGPVAKEKGYSGSGEVSDLISSMLGGDNYNLGEVMAKVVRYKNKGNEEDLLKAAAHLYLVWRRGK